ncbi:hypothetical protein F6J84_12805 [Microbacterium caowuchunii]|nr:hypothetical protein F6J84_12805 [Microbacterium caowuchunii]
MTRGGEAVLDEPGHISVILDDQDRGHVGSSQRSIVHGRHRPARYVQNMDRGSALTSWEPRDPGLWGRGMRPWLPAWWVWPIAAAGIGALAASGLYFTPPGGTLAIWWPAAGLSVWFVLVNPPRRRALALALVFVVTAGANLLSGRDPGLALGLSFANATEAFVVALLLGFGGGRFGLLTITHALRFLLAVAAGALVLGALVGATVQAVQGGDLLDAAVPAAASHAAAVLLVAPFALIPARAGDPFRWGEVAIQTAILALAILVVFRPGAYLPLAFLPFTVVTWAAFRFPMAIAFAQSLVAAVAVIALSFSGGGPFAAIGLSTTDLAITVEVFLVALATITVLMVAARNELRRATRTAATTTRLITGGFLESEVGLVIAERERGTSTVIWANDAARNLLSGELSPEGRWAGDIEAATQTALRGEAEQVHERGGTVIRLLANRVPGDPRRFAVQLVDVTSTVRMMQARTEAELERDAARTARIDLERQRDDFVATTSHELRTPITSLRGYTELLAESPRLPELERGWVEVVDRNARRLSELVEDLLTLGRARRAPVVRAAVEIRDAADYLADVALTQRPAADAKDLSLHTAVAGPLPVRAVPRDVLRALGNLVSNALKFTPDGGEVRVSAVPDGREVIFRVADTGPGMTAETLSHAFERFYRAPDAERENTPGTGLGLAITRELAERNGGSVDLHSPAGGGLVAELRLPRDLAATQRTEAGTGPSATGSGTLASSTTSAPR